VYSVISGRTESLVHAAKGEKKALSWGRQQARLPQLGSAMRCSVPRRSGFYNLRGPSADKV